MAQEPLGWHPENIKAELRKRFGTLKRFAIAGGVSQQLVTTTLALPLGSPRVERMISDALQVPLHELWPERWTEKGQKIDRSEARREIAKRKAS